MVTRRRELPAHLRRHAQQRAALREHTTASRPVPPWRIGHYDGPTDPREQIEHAKFMAFGLVPPLYYGNPGRCLSLIMKAQSLDVARATALEGVYWNLAIGKGAITSQLMAGLLKRHGYQFTVTAENDQRVAMTFHRYVSGRRRKLGDVEWTILEAIGAGLTWRHTWQHHPQDMLWARCLMRGARRHAQEVGTGLAYTEEEVADMSAPVEGSEVHTAVTELLTKAADPAVTADEIRNALVPAAKKMKLLDADAGDGRPLGHALGMLWGEARAREGAERTAAAAAAELLPPAQPAGQGLLPCQCPSRQVLHEGQHLDGCPTWRKVTP